FLSLDYLIHDHRNFSAGTGDRLDREAGRDFHAGARKIRDARANVHQFSSRAIRVLRRTDHGADAQVVSPVMHELAELQRGRLLQKLVQGTRGKQTAVGTAKKIALARDGGNNERKRAAAGAGSSGLPAATVSDAVTNQRHCVVKKSSPNEISL